MKSYKVNVKDVPPRERLTGGRGWNNMLVQVLINEQLAGSQRMVIGRTVFPPGASHDWHRHAEAEEFQLLLEGKGTVLNGDEEIPVGPGDIVFTAANEWHGFRNDSDIAPAVLLWGWGGAGSVDAAKYEARGEDA
jgi:quercetin dioxygenase-like cupin family protein